jgi:hypothetical protein
MDRKGPSVSDANQGWIRGRPYVPPRLHLGRHAASPEAKALVAHFLTELILPHLPAQARRPASLPAIARATEGLLGGLIALRDDQWARRPLSEESFTPEPGVSRAQFLKVLYALESVGLIDREKGHFNRAGPVTSGRETRLRLTETARDLVGSYKVAAKDFAEPGNGGV